MTRAMPQRVPTSEGGFSLLEMIAVMAILALAAAIAGPRMTSSRDVLRLKTAAVSLASDLRATRAAARKSNKETALLLDVKRRTYSGEGVPHTRRLPASLAVSFEVQAPSPQRSSVAAFRFRPDGTAAGGKILLKSASARASIAIDWLTGSVVLSWR